MTGQQLRNSILQEAIQGRLVPNVLRPGEKTGAELLQVILAERQKKENEEKGKKAKRLILTTIEEEPWDLPDGWCWCGIEDICTKIVDGDHNPPKGETGATDYYMLSSRNINNDSLVDLDCIRYLSKEDFDIANSRTAVKKGDILLTTVATLGRSCIFDGSINAVFQRSVTVITTLIINKYLKVYLDSPFCQNTIKDKATGTAQKGFYLNQFSLLAVPLPPLSIQKAIVSKIEELFPLVDEYEKAAVELNALNELLPDKLRKSVLQEAIHGNLVPNDIPDGEVTAPELLQQILKERQDRENKAKGKKAKKLTLSTVEEEPWDLPDGWCWCKLKDIIDFTSSGTTKNGEIASDSWILDLEDIEKDTGKLLRKKRFGEVKSLSDKRAFKTGNVLYSKLRPYLNKCIIANEDGFCTTEILAFDFGPIYNRYAQSFLMSPYFVDRVNQGAAGVKMPRVNNAEANDTCFPLPPLSIQHRIVEKIEEVFAVIDKLQA